MNRIFVLILLLFLSVSCERETVGAGSDNDTAGNVDGEEIIPDGLFSVSEFTKVKFAPGNLKKGGHGFCSHQYDYGGLFGWGTGNRPTTTSTDNYDYSEFFDWGTYNSGGHWRTLNLEEWQYLLMYRKNAYNKYGMGTVFGVRGMILLPDKWAPISGCEFKPGYGWRHNVYDSEQWAKMEKAGAVFLPAAGNRWGTIDSFVGEHGYYWIAPSEYNPTDSSSYVMCFSEDLVNLAGSDRAVGCSVRLIEEHSK